MILLSYEVLVALRHLKSRKRSRVISLLTLISVLGVWVGVWALTVVLSVLSGFGDDLRAKIIESTPNIIIERHDNDIARYRQLCDRLQKLDGVVDCAAYISSEVMLAGISNSSGALLRGIENRGALTYRLKRQIKSGKLEYLFSPEKIPMPPVITRKTIFQDSNDALTPEEEELLGLRPKRRRPPSTRPATTQATSKPAEEDLSKFGLLDTGPKKDAKKVLPGILLGKELASGLGMGVGDELRIVSPTGGSLTPMGPSPRVRKYRVAGIFFTGMYEYDLKFAFVALHDAQKLFKMRGLATGLELQVKDIHKTPQLKRDIRKSLGSGAYQVQDWIDLNTQLFGALQMEKLVMFVILTFIVLVASFNIVSTLFMVVVEKSQEIAILKSMGATNASVMLIFMIEGVIIGLIGTILGLLFGWRTCLYLIEFPIRMNTDVYYITHLPVHMKLTDFVYVAVAAILLSFIATIYPALQAARMRPVEGLRHD
ncbi:MAG: ABC transporter permease [Myxococcales bacterium]|nr:ABC transporter permease [Myxococcales bacterium]MCB9644729.1 ABC transporter permease [Myxococcales bacterium]